MSNLPDPMIVPIVKLDARNVTKLPAVNGRRSEYRDELLPAFFLRVSASGARTFGVAYNTQAGQRRRYTIGNVARNSLADAHDVARRVLADVIKGEDPQLQKVAEKRKRVIDSEIARGSKLGACGVEWRRLLPAFKQLAFNQLERSL